MNERGNPLYFLIDHHTFYSGVYLCCLNVCVTKDFADWSHRRMFYKTVDVIVLSPAWVVRFFARHMSLVICRLQEATFLHLQVDGPLVTR